MAYGQTVYGKLWHMATPVVEWCCCDQRTAAAHTLAPATVGSVQTVQRISRNTTQHVHDDIYFVSISPQNKVLNFILYLQCVDILDRQNYV